MNLFTNIIKRKMKNILLLTSLIIILFSCTNYPDDESPTGDNSVCVEGQYYINYGYYTLEFENICLAEFEGFTRDNVVSCNEISNPGADASYCYNFVYPIEIQLFPDDINHTINSDLELRNSVIEAQETLGVSYTPAYHVVYPFDVTLTLEENQPVYTVSNDEQYSEISNCEYTHCGLTFPEIEVLDVTGPNTYYIQIDFDYLYDDDEYFEIYFPDGTIESYQFSELPLTINIPHRTNERWEVFDIGVKKINTQTICTGAEFEAPRLETNCWNYLYPINVNTASEGLVVVENEEELNTVLLDEDLESQIVFPVDIIWYNEDVMNISALDYENTYKDYKCE